MNRKHNIHIKAYDTADTYSDLIEVQRECLGDCTRL